MDAKNFTSIIMDLFHLQAIRGTNAKRYYLISKANDQNFKDALKFLLDDSVTGIREKKWDKVDPATANTITDFYRYVAENNTGRDEDIAAIKAYFSTNPNWKDEVWRDAIRMFVTKTWKLGCDAKSANIAYGDNFIPQFAVMLAEKYWENVDNVTGKMFYLQQKLDGFCTIIIKRKGKVSLWSRSGKQLIGFPEVEKAVLDLPVDNIVFHGERMPIGFLNMTAAEQFKGAQNSTNKGDKEGICIAVYDTVSINEWDTQTCNRTFTERFEQYSKILKGNKFLVPLPAEYIGKDTGVISGYLKRAKKLGKEGLILKLANSNYEWKRSENILKIKVFCDADCKIIGVNSGKNKFKGKCGSFQMISPEGFEFGCGSGLNDEIRNLSIKEAEKKFIGKIAEINYHEITEKTDKKTGEVTQSYRFPTFKCIKDGN